MRRSLWTLPAAALLFAAPAALAAPEVREHTLPNGLRVLLAPDPDASGVDVGVWYRTGTRSERPGSRGATHLLERLMFRGSKNYGPGELRRRVRAEGGVANTFSTSDYSCFYETLPADALPLALSLEADRMSGPRLTAAAFAAEKADARDDQLRRGAAPLALGLERLFATAYGDHPYGAPVAGRVRDREGVTLAALTAFANARLGPSNAWLTITGRFDPDSALARVRRTFGALPARPVAPLPAAALPADGDERRGAALAAIPSPLVLAGWRAPGAEDTSRVALRVLAHLLADGGGSALSRALVQIKEPYLMSVQGDVDVRRESSLFYVFGPARPGADSTAVEGALAAEAARFVRDSVRTEDVERAKKALALEWRLARQTVRGRAQSLGEAAMLAGDWRAADGDLERLARVTAEDVRTLGAAVLRNDRVSFVWVRPMAAPRKEGSR